MMTPIQSTSTSESKPAPIAQPNRKYRLAIVVSHPIQYFSPLYRSLAEDPAIDLTVFYCSKAGLLQMHDPGFGQNIKWDIPLLDGYLSVFLGGERAGNDFRFRTIFHPSVIFEIARGKFDAVWLHGHSPPTNILAYLTCVALRIPVFMRVETHLGLQRSSWKKFLRAPLMRLYYKGCAALLAIGSANREFYMAHGVPPEKIYPVPYSVDNDFFLTRARTALARRPEIRRELGIGPTAPVILFASKFIGRKRPLDLIKAFAEISATVPEAILLMVGSGELENECKSWVAANRIERVQFLGFRNQSELPDLFAAADLFVLPSEDEPWGLVINEAMNASLPILATTGVGAARDLIEAGGNGDVVEPGDVPALAEAMIRIVKDPNTVKTFGQRSLELIGSWGIAQCQAGVVAALHAACRHHDPAGPATSGGPGASSPAP